MERLDRELTRIVSEMRAGDFGILDEYRRRLGVRGALGKLARGWLIERARVRRLRDECDEAREIAEELASMMDEPLVMPWQAEGTIFKFAAASKNSLLSQARRLAESYRLGMIGLGMKCQKLPWEADQAAKGGE